MTYTGGLSLVSEEVPSSFSLSCGARAAAVLQMQCAKYKSLREDHVCKKKFNFAGSMQYGVHVCYGKRFIDS